MLTDPKKILSYNLQLRYLEILKDKKAITEDEYQKILKKIQKEHGVVSSFLP